MAVRVYHGICNTPGSESTKNVIVRDTDISSASEFEFQDGDLLTVYFKEGNTANSITLNISNNDTNQEVSQSENTGFSAKTYNVYFDPTHIWRDGETVLFCLTQLENGTVENTNETNLFYWQVVDAGQATTEVWGITRLEGLGDEESISDWIKQDNEDDWTTALAPGMLKEFYRALGGKDETPGVDPPSGSVSLLPVVELDWDQEGAAGETLSTLGTLWLNKGGDNQNRVVIEAPIQRIVYNILNAQQESQQQSIAIPKKTSDLINDGPDPNKANKTGRGKYYITNIAPALYRDNTNNSPAYIQAYSNLVKIRPSIETTGLVLTGSGIALDANGAIGKFNALQVNTSISANTIAANGKISGNSINSTNLITERGKNLQYWYGTRMIVIGYQKRGITIPKGKHTGHLYIDLDASNGGSFNPKNWDGTQWEAVGVVGFNLSFNHNNSQGDATWCFLWECSVITLNGKKQLEYSIRNTAGRTVYIDALFYILFRRKP